MTPLLRTAWIRETVPAKRKELLDSFQVRAFEAVPYAYFGAPKLRDGNLKSKYDVIVFPHAGQGGTALITGGVQGNEPRPYKKTETTPNVGTVDSTDDDVGL